MEFKETQQEKEINKIFIKLKDTLKSRYANFKEELEKKNESTQNLSLFYKKSQLNYDKALLKYQNNELEYALDLYELGNLYYSKYLNIQNALNKKRTSMT